MSDSKYVIKEGELTLKSGILNKKHKRWCQLIRGADGLVCLDAYENKDSKEKVKSSFQLIQVKGIDKIVKESTKEYVIDVHTKKEKFSLLLSNTSETELWYDCLQDYSRFVEGREDSSSTVFEDDDDGLKDNILYDSQSPDETARIDVKLKPNEHVERLGLSVTKRYRLHVTPVCLMLEDLDIQEAKFKWYYEQLRKYGKGKGEFTIVSGRRSDSGEGTFVFIIDNPSLITKAIDRLTKRKHDEQLTNKFDRTKNDSPDQTLTNRLSEPLKKREPSPVTSRQAVSLKEGSTRPPMIIRQNSANLAHLPQDFKTELEDCVNKNKIVNEKSKSKKEKSDSKDEKKKGFGGFFKKDKNDKKTKDKHDQENEKETTKDKAYPREHLYDEPEQLEKPKQSIEPLYEDADQNISRVGPTAGKKQAKQAKRPTQPQNLYAQAHPERNQAWKEQGQEDEYHLEQYEGIKAARQNRVSLDIKHDDEDDIDDTYDHAFLTDRNKAKAKSLADSKNIYGVSSGQRIEIPEADYEFGDEDEQVEYDDAVSTQLRFNQNKMQPQFDAYEEVDLMK